MTGATARERLLALIVLASAAVFVAKAAAPEAFAAWEGGLIVFGALVKLVCLALAFALSADCTARFEPGAGRRAWRLLNLGLGGYLLGQMFLAYYQVYHEVFRRQPAPFPSLADVFFLASYPLLIAALATFLRAYDEAGFDLGGRRERGLVFAGATALVALLAVFVLRPILAAPAPPLEKLVNVAYAVLDCVLLLPTTLLLRATLHLRGGNVQRVWLALLIGLAGLTAGDVLFGFFSSLGWSALDPVLHALFILAYGFIALGTLAQRELLAR